MPGRVFFPDEDDAQEVKRSTSSSSGSILVTPRNTDLAASSLTKERDDVDEKKPSKVVTLSYELSSERSAREGLGVVAHKQGWLDIKDADKGIWTRRFVRLHQDRLEWFLSPLEDACEGSLRISSEQCVITAECRFAVIPCPFALIKFRTRTEEETQDWVESIELALLHHGVQQRSSPTKRGMLLRSNSSRDAQDGDEREIRHLLFAATSKLETICKDAQVLQDEEESLFDMQMQLSYKIRAAEMTLDTLISPNAISEHERLTQLIVQYTEEVKELKEQICDSTSSEESFSTGYSSSESQKSLCDSNSEREFPFVHPQMPLSSVSRRLGFTMYNLSNAYLELNRFNELMEGVPHASTESLREFLETTTHARDQIDAKLFAVSRELQRTRGELRDCKNRIQHYEHILEHLRHQRGVAVQKRFIDGLLSPPVISTSQKNHVDLDHTSASSSKRTQNSAGLVRDCEFGEKKPFDFVNSTVIARHADRFRQLDEQRRTDIALAGLIT